MFPFLVLLILGVIESGFAWRDSNVLARATQQAARTAARVADGQVADYEALRALESGLAGLSASSVQRVIVYEASSTGDSPPAACLALGRPNDLSARGVSGVCNVYSAAQVTTDSPGSFGSCSGTWDAAFCTANRVRSGDDPHRVGVWIELSFDEVTSVLPGSLTLTRASVYQLEPCVAGDPTC